MKPTDKAQLQSIYEDRFGDRLNYRDTMWTTLCSTFWQRLIPPDAAVLDLGCGYGQFINHIRCHCKWAMDLNPLTRQYLDSSVQFLEQDCSACWNLADGSLDVVFTSNFLEHLGDKESLAKALAEAYRCLKSGGLFVAMGPNIKYLPGKYWDFWDHYLPLTEMSLAEGLRLGGFLIEKAIGKFLPYTMVKGPRFPALLIALYLRLPVFWSFFGKQFLVIARKPNNRSPD